MILFVQGWPFFCHQPLEPMLVRKHVLWASCAVSIWLMSLFWGKCAKQAMACLFRCSLGLQREIKRTRNICRARFETQGNNISEPRLEVLPVLTGLGVARNATERPKRPGRFRWFCCLGVFVEGALVAGGKPKGKPTMLQCRSPKLVGSASPG